MTKRTYIDQGAIFNEPERTHRFSLWRQWGDLRPRFGTVLWVMLNPSTADEKVLDPTIRRCEDYSKAWGFGGLVVCNLFAYRATKPKNLKRAARAGVDVVGPGNDDAIRERVQQADLVVAAWGVPGALNGRGTEVLAYLVDEAGEKLCHLGRNADLSPRHPLMLLKTLKPIPWARVE